MRVALHHQLLGLGAYFVAPELAPGDEELLIGRKAVNDRRRIFLAGFLKSQAILRPARSPMLSPNTNLPLI
jgi:hypothetical protein